MTKCRDCGETRTDIDLDVLHSEEAARDLQMVVDQLHGLFKFDPDDRYHPAWDRRVQSDVRRILHIAKALGIGLYAGKDFDPRAEDCDREWKSDEQ